MYQESNFQSEFNEAIRNDPPIIKHHLGKQFAAELKIMKGKDINKIMSFPFKKLKGHQEKALIDVTLGRGDIFKIPDMPKPKPQPKGKKSKIRFIPRKPFDCFYMSDTKAYVIILFYIPRKLKRVFVLDIDLFRGVRSLYHIEGRKSIRMSELSNHVDLIYDLKTVGGKYYLIKV